LADKKEESVAISISQTLPGSLPPKKSELQGFELAPPQNELSDEQSVLSSDGGTRQQLSAWTKSISTVAFLLQ